MLASIIIFEFLLTISGGYAFNYGVKIAVSNHLLVWYQVLPPIIRYQCTIHRDKFQSIQLNDSSVYSLSIGKLQNESQLYFVVAGMTNFIPYMSKISIHCDNDQVNIETVYFKELKYSLKFDHFVVTVGPHGRFAIGCTSFAILFYDLISLKHWNINITWSNAEIFSPTAIDITNRFLYIVGYTPIPGEEGYEDTLYYKADFYIMTISFNHSEYDVNILCVWTSDIFFSDSTSIYSITIGINYANDGRSILIGIPPMNTIHLFSFEYTTSVHLKHLSKKTYINKQEGYGHGSGIAWLNQGQVVAVLNIFRRSTVLYYTMLPNDTINNNTEAFSYFPQEGFRNYPYHLDRDFRFIVTSMNSVSTLYVYNIEAQVLIIPPSSPGYYSVHYKSLEGNLPNELPFPLLLYYIPDSVQCEPGTYKNDAGVWTCSICKVDLANSSFRSSQLNNKNITSSCPQCLNSTACPLEILTEHDYLLDIEQNGVYPESPEIDVFDDVLMDFIFQTNWNLKMPFCILMIVLLIVLIIAGLISFLKLSTRFASQQKSLMTFFQHLDLIGQGESWFGGLISILILVLTIFAAKFSYSYHNRYPIEKNIFDNLLNAKFDTSLQLLSTSIKQHEEIFDLLNSQEFTLNIELINTRINCGDITLTYETKINVNSFSCRSNDRILYISVKLHEHNLNIKLESEYSATIDGLRIGLTGPDVRSPNNYVQKLNFTKQFNRTDRLLSKNPVIHLQITKSINITESLTDNDNTTYTGLWLPIFIYDIVDLFLGSNVSSNQDPIIISIPISESIFYVKNKQEPIARRSEIIFHVILFIGLCIDLTCLILLLLKMWLAPIIIYLIRKVFPPNSVVHHLVYSKKNATETMILTEKVNAQEMQIKILQQQNETMLNTIKKLLDFMNNSKSLTEQHLKESTYF